VYALLYMSMYLSRYHDNSGTVTQAFHLCQDILSEELMYASHKHPNLWMDHTSPWACNDPIVVACSSQRLWWWNACPVPTDTRYVTATVCRKCSWFSCFVCGLFLTFDDLFWLHRSSVVQESWKEVVHHKRSTFSVLNMNAISCRLACTCGLWECSSNNLFEVCGLQDRSPWFMSKVLDFRSPSRGFQP
jgi:hypothetical protein